MIHVYPGLGAEADCYEAITPDNNPFLFALKERFAGAIAVRHTHALSDGIVSYLNPSDIIEQEKGESSIEEGDIIIGHSLSSIAVTGLSKLYAETTALVVAPPDFEINNIDKERQIAKLLSYFQGGKKTEAGTILYTSNGNSVLISDSFWNDYYTRNLPTYLQASAPNLRIVTINNDSLYPEWGKVIEEPDLILPGPSHSLRNSSQIAAIINYVDQIQRVQHQ